MVVQRGDVYFIDLDPALGREQRGRRPVVVMSRDSLNRMPLVVVIIPGTSAVKGIGNYMTNVLVPAGIAGLPRDTVFMAFQVRAVDHNRFADPPIGRLNGKYMDALERAMAYTLDFPMSTTTSSAGRTP